MSIATIKIHEMVENAVNHKWSIPEFQRGFVWKTVQVRDLAESLFFKYPIGSLLVWNSGSDCEERSATDAQRPSLWVVDGQQRTTALSILFGRKPYWWPSNEEWEKATKKYDIRFDVEAKEPPFFWVANAGIRKSKKPRYIPLRDLLILDIQKEDDQKTLGDLAEKIKIEGLCDGENAMSVYTRLSKICSIRDRDVGTITIDHDLEDVVEIFSRLNSRGTRVTEADIYLGVVAARSPGWVRDEFLPYLNKLKDAGFDINPNLLFRTLTGIGIKKVKFKEVEDSFWDHKTISAAWTKTQKAWKSLLIKFKEYGVLSNAVMPTQAALVTITSLVDKYGTSNFNKFMYWFLQASRFSRYSGSGTTSLEEDLRIIRENDDPKICVEKLLEKFETDREFVQEDFLRDYSDSRFGRFLLYLMIYENKAKDWDENGNRIGFDGAEILEDFKPQWHHVFPVKYLKDSFDDDKINALANIAVIGPTINIRISAKAPMQYIEKYKIDTEKLNQQFIHEDIVNFKKSEYEKWLEHRAEVLSQKANEYINKVNND